MTELNDPVGIDVASAGLLGQKHIYYPPRPACDDVNALDLSISLLMQPTLQHQSIGQSGFAQSRPPGAVSLD
jgi:hypothetical protein